MEKNVMILGQGQEFSLDTRETQLNNNVLVVGTSGAGKTRGIVVPNLLQATGSYIVSDPKGNLYQKYGNYLKSKGYKVRKLDFTNPMDSAHYNFFEYIQNTQDIVKIAHMLVYQRPTAGRTLDPFWDEASQLLLQAIIGYLKERVNPSDRNIHGIMRMADMCQTKGDLEDNQTQMDMLMERLEQKDPDSYALGCYKKFRVAASKTLRSIMITLNARLGIYDNPMINKITQKDDIDIASIGKEKTALFVVVSDTDRSLDGLINIFFTQAMNELCTYADRKCGGELPVPVRFIMDDFATNCKIEDFPRMISSIRSRGISTMIMIQAESQLVSGFDKDSKTIIGNCDTYVYLGGNDIDTAKAIAERCDVPLKKVLYMPIGTSWIFRRGQEPINARNVQLEQFINEHEELHSLANSTHKGRMVELVS